MMRELNICSHAQASWCDVLWLMGRVCLTRGMKMYTYVHRRVCSDGFILYMYVRWQVEVIRGDSLIILLIIVFWVS